MTRNARSTKRFVEVLSVQSLAKTLRQSGKTVSEIKQELKDLGRKVSYLYPKRINW